MNFDMLDLMKSGEPEGGHEPTELHQYEATKNTRGKGLENKVTLEDKERAEKILGQLHEAQKVLDQDKKSNFMTDDYDVFDHAEEALNDFYIKEAHMSPGEAKKVAKKMAELYKVVEEVDELIDDKIYKYTMADAVPDRRGIWDDVVKITRKRLEAIKLNPAKIEVILDDLYNKKIEWVREPKRKLQPLPEKRSKEDRFYPN